MRARRASIKALEDGGADADDIILERASYRAVSQEYTRFSKAMGLREQRERVMIDGLGSVGAGKFTVRTKIAEFDKQDKSITPITDSAIKRVPMAKIQGYTNEQCEYIQDRHKQLLMLAREANEGKEVAVIFSNDFLEESINFGENDKLEFRSKESINMLTSRRNLFIMHNHPRNSSFSANDIDTILKTDSIRSMSIVKNNGGIEVLTKTEKYDKMYMRTEYMRLIKKNVRQGTKKEYDTVVSKLIAKAEKEGMLIWLKI